MTTSFKTKAILFLKISFLGLVLASFFVMEDPLISKCRKARLVVEHLNEQASQEMNSKHCKIKFEQASLLLETAQDLERKKEVYLKKGIATNSVSIQQANTEIERLRSEAETLFDEIILTEVFEEQLAVIGTTIRM